MRIFIFSLVVLVICSSASSQSPYSNQSLNDYSLEDLNLYLSKAQNLKKAGTILTITGPLTMVGGIILFNGSWSGSFGNSFTAGTGLIMILGGPVLLLTGVPVLFTGINRISRIGDVIKTKHGNVNLELGIKSHYYSPSNSYHHGIALRINF